MWRVDSFSKIQISNSWKSLLPEVTIKLESSFIVTSGSKDFQLKENSCNRDTKTEKSESFS